MKKNLLKTLLVAVGLGVGVNSSWATTKDIVETYDFSAWGQAHMKKSDVNGANELPLYTYLKSQKGFEGFDENPLKSTLENMFNAANPDWAKTPDIKWNFTKFVIDRKGNVVARFEPTADMKEVEKCVASLI